MAEDYEIDDLVDVIEGSRVYIPAIYVVNKIDQVRRASLSLSLTSPLQLDCTLCPPHPHPHPHTHPPRSRWRSWR